MKEYDDLIKKIKDLTKIGSKKSSKAEISPKEVKLENLLKNFEDKHFIPISMIFTEEGLVVSTGIEPENKWLNVDIVGAFGAEFLRIINTFIEEVLAKPHTDPDSRISEYVGDSKRITKIKTNFIETEVEGQPIGILFCPIESIGFYLAIIINPALKNIELLQKIKDDLPKLIDDIKNVFE